MFQEGIWAPTYNQLNHVNLLLEGKLPSDLCGTYYRNGPNPLILGEEGYHQFDGDGMVHCINISEGKATYSNHWLQTDKFIIESNFKRKVACYYKEYIELYSKKLSDKAKQFGPANTNVLFFANKLFALHENSAPVEIDLLTCRVLRQWDYSADQSYKMMTAHPKRCPLTGELDTFSYDPVNGELYYYRVVCWEKIRQKIQVKLPYKPLLIHDFAVTKNYILFAIFPLVVENNNESTAQICWKPEYQSYLIILDKNTGAIKREYKFDACFSFHFINAYQADNKLFADLFIYEKGIEHDQFWQPIDKPCIPCRIKINLANDEFSFEKIVNISGEFGTIDPQYLGKVYTHFAMCTSPLAGKNYEYNGIALINSEEGNCQRFDFDSAEFCTEPLIVSSNNKKNNYIMTLVTDRLGTSNLSIFEQNKVEDGPICRLLIPNRIPFGFHGTWVPNNITS